MNLIRRRNETGEIKDPFAWMERLFPREFERMFNQVGSPEGKQELTFADWSPAVDVTEDVESYVIKAELPQIKKEEVKLTVQEGILTLAGERKAEKEEKGKKFHRIERSYGSFVRSFTLPDNVDESRILAEFGEGVLTIRLPKTEKPRNDVREIKVG